MLFLIGRFTPFRHLFGRYTRREDLKRSRLRFDWVGLIVDPDWTSNILKVGDDALP